MKVMSIKQKTLLIYLISFAIAFAVISYYMNNKIYAVFYKLERKHFQQESDLVINSIKNKIKGYEATLKDWAQWDDTFKFVSDLNPAYISSNLMVQTLDTLGLSSIIFFNKDMKSVYKLTYEEDAQIYGLAIAEMESSGKTLSDKALHGNGYFFLSTRGGKLNLLGVITPITHSDGKGEQNGFMVMTAAINDKFINDLNSTTGFHLEQISSLQTPHAGLQSTDYGIKYKITYDNHNYAVQDFVFDDITGNSFLSLQFVQERAFNSYMHSVLNSSVVILAVLGALTVVLVNTIIDKLVLSELRSKIDKFKKIEQSNDLSVRLKETGSKEIMELAVAVNKALDKIEKLNREVVDVSNTDSLTKIHNRKYFNEQYPKLFRAAMRNVNSISALLLDIDYFKNYNDSKGHLKGDECLREIAEVLQDAVKRPEDLLARFGGEEFIIILPDTDEKGAIHIAEMIRSNLGRKKIPHPSSLASDHVTVSIGIAAVIPKNESEMKQLIEDADNALYSAKHSGRDCIVFSA